MKAAAKAPSLLPPGLNPEAERAVLGACLIDPEQFHAVCDIGIASGDFDTDLHRELFAAMVALDEAG